ncbi:MAG: peptide deformylase [Candidatus Stygibacter australis]|nr:peptide deformylase [Candidatus Stygibacter australis]MDP8321265.1 peptide deformylase [Candidatus Stygibacter australis]
MQLVDSEVLPIRIIGDKVLRRKADEVAELTDEIRKFIKDLTLTMYEDDGVGLAAPQVGRSLRIFVVDPYWYREGHQKNPLVLINPHFVEFSGEEEEEEGCLSLPEIWGKVTRAERVVIEGLNENFEPVRYEAEGFFARSLQHENDHLDGILFIDKIPPLQRVRFARKIKELKSTTNEEGVNIKQKQHEDQ